MVVEALVYIVWLFVSLSFSVIKFRLQWLHYFTLRLKPVTTTSGLVCYHLCFSYNAVASQNASPSSWQLWRIDPSTAPLRPTYSRVSPMLPTWHPDDGCGLLLYLSSSGSSARSSLCSLQAGVSGFWCRRLERPASPRRICAVTRGFQTTTQALSVFPFLPRHYHMTRVTMND